MTDDWNVEPVPARIVAIGDLHGDVRAFGAIARACGLVDEHGAWAGGDAHVVLMGDLVGGNRSRLLLAAVMRLEREAERVGGRVFSLLGNHDVLPIAGRMGKMSRQERSTYGEDDFRTGPLAEWLRARPTILKIGETIFVHAGLDRWALDTDRGELNAHVRAWIAHRQGLGERPPKSTAWTMDEDGPLFTRAFKPRRGKRKDGPSRKTLRAILERWGASRVVLGHSPTKHGGIILEHPHYGSSVILVDTRISDDERGKLAALVITRDALSPIYALDRAAGESLEVREAIGDAPTREGDRRGEERNEGRGIDGSEGIEARCEDDPGIAEPVEARELVMVGRPRGFWGRVWDAIVRLVRGG